MRLLIRVRSSGLRAPPHVVGDGGNKVCHGVERFEQLSQLLVRGECEEGLQAGLSAGQGAGASCRNETQAWAG